MKKNISINVSGIIFHIEEDGYEKLKKYLDSINQYFSTYDDSSEIITDIESRIAEIFLNKLKEGKQIITLEDIHNLISTMGSVRDFQAVEEKTEPLQGNEDKDKENSSQNYQESYRPNDTEFNYSQRHKKLERDGKRKIIGGVAAGIANYFNIDPLWIRLVMIILSLNIFFTSMWAGIFVIYIILWIILPESFNLEEDKKVKKFYRNPDDKILGGVSSGIAAYFALEPLIFRLIFIISIFLGGSGIIIYIILWAITPEANSITEKMQMQGEPVTLNNIENTIRKNFNVKANQEESVFMKVILFPFRIISEFLKVLGKGFGPFFIFLADFIRIIIGLAIVLTAISLMIALFAITGIIFGSIFSPDWIFPSIPIEQIRSIFPTMSTISGFILIFIPLLLIAILGIGVIMKRNLIHQSAGWALFSVWLLSIITFVVFAPGAIVNFKSEGIYKTSQTFEASSPVFLTINETGNEDYQVTTLKLKGHNGNVLLLEKNFKSRGRSREDAKENASAVIYNVFQKDSVLTFDSNIQFTKDVPFRFQDLQMTLFIPYNQEFKMDRDLATILRNTISPAGYSAAHIPNNTWVFTEDGLACTTCSQKKVIEKEVRVKGNQVDLGFTDFHKLDIAGNYDINIQAGKAYKVTLRGREKDISNIKAEVVQQKLTLSSRKSSLDLNKRVKIDIVMPELTYAAISGTGRSEIVGFKSDSFELDLAGANTCKLQVDAEDLNVDVAGACKLTIKGKGEKIKIGAAGASKIEAFDFFSSTATAEAIGASTIHLSVSDNLDAEAVGASKIVYKGDPLVRSSANIISSVKRY